MPLSILQNKTPYEILLGKILTYGHLRTSGWLCYEHVNSEPRDKFALRFKPQIFVGYPNREKGYKIFDLESKMIYVSSDVQFFEDTFLFANHLVTDLDQATTLDHEQTSQLAITKFPSPIIADESAALGPMPSESLTESFPSTVTSPEQIIPDPSIVATSPSNLVEPTALGKLELTIIPTAPVVSVPLFLASASILKVAPQTSPELSTQLALASTHYKDAHSSSTLLKMWTIILRKAIQEDKSVPCI
ncbi:hypothetical protein ACH5RR_036981 [Cinchona calisaya]|uniref:Retroviral polymerase SH3-like domain-containing protein n=1 Tax=Cinchona calisaya TaxID=153742 RepID=A0ABD2Y9I3_9GENT